MTDTHEIRLSLRDGAFYRRLADGRRLLIATMNTDRHRLLAMLASRPRRIFTHSEILQELRVGHNAKAGIIYSAVSQLNEKLRNSHYQVVNYALRGWALERRIY
jgi:DNA-binding response OmpR family regulator